MSEANLWRYVRSKVPGVLVRIETGTLNGVPDVAYAICPGLTGWLELKYLAEWPKRLSTRVQLGFRMDQAIFLDQWAAAGGRGRVLAQVANDYVLFDRGFIELSRGLNGDQVPAAALGMWRGGIEAKYWRHPLMATRHGLAELL